MVKNYHLTGDLFCLSNIQFCDHGVYILISQQVDKKLMLVICYTYFVGVYIRFTGISLLMPSSLNFLQTRNIFLIFERKTSILGIVGGMCSGL